MLIKFNFQGDQNQPDKKIRKRIKRANTVEKNIKNLNIAKFEQEFDVDPLFKKKSSELDGAVGGNQFLSTLEVRDETGELILDSEVKKNDILHIFIKKKLQGHQQRMRLEWQTDTF